MALCGLCPTGQFQQMTSDRKRSLAIVSASRNFTTWSSSSAETATKMKRSRLGVNCDVNQHEDLKTHLVVGGKDLNMYKKIDQEIVPNQLPILNYEYFQQVALPSSTVPVNYSNYYQVLADMRVVKYVFDHHESARTSYAVPIWRCTVIGEYVFFPSEQKWIFVNACTDEPIEADISYYHDFGMMNYDANHAPAMPVSMPPPPLPQPIPMPRKIVPKFRYCAHRSHTPSTDFAQVVHREPVRENWPVLMNKLLALKYHIDSNNDRRFRNNMNY